jgi:inner membrane protein
MLGGIAAGSLTGRRLSGRLIAACALAGALPDIDFLLPMPHRGPAHSLAAAAAVGALSAAVVSFRASKDESVRVGLAIALAYASHVLLDWLGADSSTPRGLMALWPFSSEYYISDANIFRAITRRYWQDDFWWMNTLAILQELAILGPLLVIILRRSRSRTSRR